MRAPLRFLLATALVVLLAGCGSGPERVSLERLAFEADGFSGKAVRTSGVVVAFSSVGEPQVPHYVIQDAAQNRVQLLPDAAAAPHVGQVVIVEGTFLFDEATGRRLEIESIEPANESAGGSTTRTP